jgi:hypothetical protein
MKQLVLGPRSLADDLPFLWKMEFDLHILQRDVISKITV